MNTQPVQIKKVKVIPLTPGQKLIALKGSEKPPESDLSGNRQMVAIATKGKIEMILFSEILYVESESNYIRFHLVNKGIVFAAKTLKEVSGLLEKAGFMRVHKSYMLHPANVKQYDLTRSFLFLRSGEKIPVSRSNRKMVSEKLLTCFC